MSSQMIKRHTGWGIFMHWFNAACWFFLLASGLGLINNPALNPLGQWWPDMMRAIFGASGLLVAHWSLALLWLAVWVLFIIIHFSRFAVPFVIQVFTVEPRRDLEWMMKKNLQMTLGYKMMARMVKPLKMGPAMPEQEYYNAGQKLAAQGLLMGALVLIISGFFMLASKYILPEADVVWVQWSITIHFIAAGVTTALLLLHIYMAAISKDERPAFISMFTGQVPVDYAEHHHKIWLDQVRDSSPASNK